MSNDALLAEMPKGCRDCDNKIDPSPQTINIDLNLRLPHFGTENYGEKILELIQLLNKTDFKIGRISTWNL